MNEFFWIALPYLAFTFFLGGTAVRYTFFERGWSAKSSEFLEKKQLKIAGPLFHLGLLFTFGGHFGGILVPKLVTEASGVTDEMYHMGALAGGTMAGTLLVAGFLLLLRRRFLNGRMAVNTSCMDKWLFLLLFLTIASGCAATASNVSGAFDYRTTIAPWFRGLLMLQPDASLMAGVPALFKAHMISWMLVAIVFPFTRLVHCLSFPFEYLWRSAIVYRRK